MTRSLDRTPVLVTGGCGFIGQHMVSALKREGASIRVLTRSIPKARNIWTNGAVECVEGDLVDPRTLNGVCDGIDTVFHLAGHAHIVSRFSRRPKDGHWAVNVEGTRSLIAAAVAAGVKRFVYVSSIKAIGENGGACLNESSPPEPLSPYGRSKLAAEEAVLKAGLEHDIHISILRLSLVYGNNCKGNLPLMIASIDHGRFPPLPEVDNRRSLVHVDDVVEALLLAARCPETRNQVYIVTDGKTYSTRYIYTLICEALGKPVPRWHVPMGALKAAAALGDYIGRLRGRHLVFDSDTLEKLVGSACYSSEKIARELGFHPRHTLETAMPEIIAEYRKTGSGFPLSRECRKQ